MTKKRMLAAGAAMALTLGLGAGIAAAQTDPTTPTRPPEAGTMHNGDMDATHEQMRDQMPDEMQAQCDTMHAQGGAMTDGMMNGDMGDQMMGGDMTPPWLSLSPKSIAPPTHQSAGRRRSDPDRRCGTTRSP